MKIPDEGQFRQMMKEYGEHCASVALRRAGLDKNTIHLNEAYTRAGRRKVDRWIRDGVLKTTKDGRSVLIDLNEFEAVLRTNRLYSKHLNV